jgi:hypothetical protein
VVNVILIEQSAPDLRRKLQQIEGAVGMNSTQLVDIAYKVYNTRRNRK